MSDQASRLHLPEVVDGLRQLQVTAFCVEAPILRESFVVELFDVEGEVEVLLGLLSLIRSWLWLSVPTLRSKRHGLLSIDALTLFLKGLSAGATKGETPPLPGVDVATGPSAGSGSSDGSDSITEGDTTEPGSPTSPCSEIGKSRTSTSPSVAISGCVGGTEVASGVLGSYIS